jgi:ATP-dependent protease HslVU (ClpYQ) peptidase subunit
MQRSELTMTVIVGLVHGGRVLIGGDSAGLAGYQLSVRADPKVFRNGPYVFGFTSSFRMGQLLHHAFTPPEPPADPDGLHRFMCTVWIDAVRQCLKDGGWATVDSAQERGGDFMVGVDGRLFEVHGDFQVAELDDGYAAMGCGDDVALGALYATGTPGTVEEPERRILTALSAAQRHSGGVRSPFVLKWTPARDPALT